MTTQGVLCTFNKGSGVSSVGLLRWSFSFHDIRVDPFPFCE